MKFNKYHFFWIVPCVVVVTLLLQRRLEPRGKENNIAVRVTIKVPRYDQFKLYFAQDGQEKFTEEYSIQRNILGMNGYQTISFYLPDSVAISKLRLDIGLDPEQRVVEIHEVIFDNGVNSISVPLRDLTPNVFIDKIDGARYYSKTVNDKFDPYLEFSHTSINDLNKLRDERSINIYITFLLALLITLCLWFAPQLIRINRYSPHYIITGVIIFIVFGWALQKFMSTKVITITVDAIIKKDDVLQTFLQSSKSTSFTEDHAISKKVFGSDERQQISFVFNDTTDINKVRIDISQNANQPPIQVFQISIERDRKLTLEGADIFSAFLTNDFITKEQGSTTLSMSRLEDSYSPYDPFIFSTDMYAYLSDLKAQRQNRIHFLPYLISLLFTSVIVFYLVFNTTGTLPQHNFFEYGFSVFFLLILVLPSVDQIFRFNINLQSTEKRALAEKPKFKIAEIDRYPKNFETYFNDNFGFRNLLIRLGSNIKTNLFKASPAPDKVTIGKDNWIFLSGESYGVAQDIKRENLLSHDQLEKWVSRSKAKRDTLATKGIKSYMALWPDKHNIYKLYLPFSMKVQLKDTLSKTDQMIHAAQEADSALEIIDVRKDLIAKIPTVDVYLKNDTHWNEYGAFVAYQTLMRRITKDFPQVLPVKTIEDYEITWHESTDGDLLNIMGVQANDILSITFPLLLHVTRPKTLPHFRLSHILQPLFCTEMEIAKTNYAS